MCLLSFLKLERSNGVDLHWLEKADKAYERAFQIKNSTLLTPYMTRECLVRTVERVRCGEKAYSGITRYQHTNWILKCKTTEEQVFHKVVTYDQIKISSGIYAAVGDEYTEVWKIVQIDNENKISEIRRIS